MTGHRTKPAVVAPLLAVVLATALAGGCSSTRGEQMVQSFAKTREKVGEARTYVDRTLLTLGALRVSRAETLKDAFRQYRDAVAKLEEEGEDAKWRAMSLQEDVDGHIRAWQKEMETFHDPTVKASLESRREAVRSNFALVKMYAADARKAYEPCLRGNKEIVRALSLDLSPAAITSLAPAMDRATADGQALRERIVALQIALNNIANGVSPLGEMK